MVIFEMIPTISIGLALVMPLAFGKLLHLTRHQLHQLSLKSGIFYLICLACLLAFIFSVMAFHMPQNMAHICGILDILYDCAILYFYFDTKIRSNKEND